MHTLLLHMLLTLCVLNPTQQFVDASIIPPPSSAVYIQSSMHPASASAARVMDSQYIDTGNTLSPYSVQPSAIAVVNQPADLTSICNVRTHLACTHAQSVYATTVTQAQPTLPSVPASFVQLQPPLPTPLVELQPPRHIPLVEVGATVCTPAVQAPLTYNPVQCLVRQTTTATTSASSVPAPVHSSTVGATQLKSLMLPRCLLLP